MFYDDDDDEYYSPGMIIWILFYCLIEVLAYFMCSWIEVLPYLLTNKLINTNS